MSALNGKFAMLLRRELWEHRTFWLAPVVVIGTALIMALIQPGRFGPGEGPVSGAFDVTVWPRVSEPPIKVRVARQRNCQRVLSAGHPCRCRSTHALGQSYPLKVSVTTERGGLIFVRRATHFHLTALSQLDNMIPYEAALPHHHQAGTERVVCGLGRGNPRDHHARQDA